jgi:hypothetical protein
MLQEQEEKLQELIRVLETIYGNSEVLSKAKDMIRYFSFAFVVKFLMNKGLLKFLFKNRALSLNEERIKTLIEETNILEGEIVYEIVGNGDGIIPTISPKYYFILLRNFFKKFYEILIKRNFTEYPVPSSVVLAVLLYLHRKALVELLKEAYFDLSRFLRRWSS